MTEPVHHEYNEDEGFHVLSYEFGGRRYETIVLNPGSHMLGHAEETMTFRVLVGILEDPHRQQITHKSEPRRIEAGRFRNHHNKYPVTLIAIYG